MRLLVLGTVLLTAGACGSSGLTSAPTPTRTATHSAIPTPAPVPGSTGGPMPTVVPAAAGEVRTRGLVTILDDGGGPELCLGGVATSLPPQCGGPAVDWDWAEHRGAFEERSGVRWGEFALVGRFDGTRFRPTDAVPAAVFDPKADPVEDVDLSTPCPEPDGGWRVLDPARTTADSLDAATSLARRLAGYADVWLDQSRNPAFGSREEGMTNDPAYITLNVRVTRDVAGAQAELRKVWGGALCVTTAEHTQRELVRIKSRMTKLPGMLMSSSDFGHVDVEVVHDDGTLQAWADATYGPGLVRISSALVPASG